MMKLLCLAVILLAPFLCIEGQSSEGDGLEARLTQLERTVMRQGNDIAGIEATLQEMGANQQGSQEPDDNLLIDIADIEATLQELGAIQQGSQEPEDNLLTGPCRSGEYRMLNNSWRSTSNVMERSDYDYRCDNNLVEGWYRFFLNGQNAIIPTRCIRSYHCQTAGPIWVDLQGQSMPDSGEEIQARACALSGACCMWYTHITVRNCGSFFVYRVDPLSKCHHAFCTEPQP
ncbi:oncoprotein-induced transcript 3 protein-like isoform X1 [Babylonia areolata]|uniref:oncoprotein-induced transcript 3 protein-like isoform X1 n=1 Tax=Babylonia areolata TaxID=304850 RepID=UPI003FD42153